MFSNFKDKLLNVQEYLSSSLQVLKVTEPAQLTVRGNVTKSSPFDAALANFQKEWQSIHFATENHARLAQNIDKVIADKHSRCKKMHKSIEDLNSVLSHIGLLLKECELCVNIVAEIRSKIDDTENLLIDLEDTIEKQELFIRQTENERSLETYRNQKLAKLDVLRATLAAEYEIKIRDLETESIQNTLTLVNLKQMELDENCPQDKIEAIKRLESKVSQDSTLLKQLYDKKNLAIEGISISPETSSVPGPPDDLDEINLNLETDELEELLEDQPSEPNTA